MKTTGILVLCSFFLLPLPTDRRYLDHLHAGDRLYAGFDNDGALAEYSKAFVLAPRNFDVLVRMARIHNDIGRSLLWEHDSAEHWYAQAVVHAERLLTEYPNRAESYFWLALTKGSLVPFRGAREKLEIGREVTDLARNAIRLDSTQAQAYTILGIVYREGARLTWYEKLIANIVFGGSLPGTLEESESMFHRSIELQPRNIFAHYELARTYRLMEKQERAAATLRQVLELQPESLREKQQQESASRQLRRLSRTPSP